MASAGAPASAVLALAENSGRNLVTWPEKVKGNCRTPCHLALRGFPPATKLRFLGREGR